MMKRALAVILAAGFAVSVYATDARVRVMGRQETPYFYRDEVSVFTNPADMSLYPNLIYGSFGWMGPEDSSGNFGRQKNVQPLDPLFGGMISYGFSDEESGPMLSIGAFVNRRDYMLEKLIKAGGYGSRGLDVTPGATEWNGNNLVDPLGKFDLMLGYDIGNGFAMGLGFYTAYQCVRENGDIRNQTAIYKGTAGINYNIEQGLDLEASVNGGLTNARWTYDRVSNLADVAQDTTLRVLISDNDYFVRGDLRFFTAVPAINGSFVPQVSLTYMTLNRADIVDVAGGVGINMNIDRGFFWAGLQGIYTQENSQKNVGASGDPQRIGARLSFGIERNIVWDWFLIRVGGQKEFQYETKNGDTKSAWLENPSSNGWDNDLVGLGFGINIDNRLRIDFVASEDLPYTLTNLISGSQYHLFNRVSATYRF
ncbi:MAG: hypothetical protein LBB74_10780 [Chitinispirillales bacterium]|jgi:hypothetical protein|nr:hypothetical protein [Chitinispirillales bacterium]